LLQEQALAAEREKYAVGASTGFYVMQYQRDLAASQSAEVSALAGYEKARTALERAVGTIVDDYGITVGEATSGVVSRGGKE
jgi:outer membrane protein